jgi:hypothetical protein
MLCMGEEITGKAEQRTHNMQLDICALWAEVHASEDV